MKKLFTAILTVVAIMSATVASAKVQFGLKGGLNVTNMSLNADELISNKAGFFVGPTVKFTVPIVGIGFDAAVVYDQRNADIDEYSLKQQSINIPINLRYNYGFSSLVGVYIAAGPQFGIGIGDKSISFEDYGSYDISDTNFSINVGAGVTLLNHLEVGFTYNIACGKTGELNVVDVATSTFKGRSNAWQVSAAYYF